MLSNPSRRARVRLALIPAGLAALALTAAACSSSSGGTPTRTVTETGSASAQQGGGTSPAAPSSSSAPKTVVSITTLNNDGAEYGVGMPVIAFFSKKPSSAKAWQDDTKVTADGKPLEAAWFFEYSESKQGPIEAHLRPQNYWPAHSHIHVTFPAKGTSLGGDMVTDGKLSSLDFSIGPRNITVVDNSTHTVKVSSDGKLKYTFPTSLGASNTPTKRGIKVIMEKGVDIPMRGPGYYDPHVKYTQRLTYGGEYLHAAPWNTYNIEHGINSSNGCTNLEDSNAITLYNFLRIGDVVTYPNATGPAMRLGDGYGDWNVSWSQWKTGGLVSTT